MRVHQLQATMRGAPASIEMCFASATDQIQGVSRNSCAKLLKPPVQFFIFGRSRPSETSRPIPTLYPLSREHEEDLMR